MNAEYEFTLRCNKTRARLAERAAGVLAPGDAREVDAHAAECNECSRILAGDSGVVTKIHSFAAAEARAQMNNTDAGALLARHSTPAQGTAARRSSREWLRFAPLAAAFFLLGIAGGVWWSALESKQQIESLHQRLTILERAQPAVIDAAREAAEPAFEALLAAMGRREERFETVITNLAQWVEGERRRDAQAFAGAILDTRDHLELTKNAVLGVARSIPDIR